MTKTAIDTDDVEPPLFWCLLCRHWRTILGTERRRRTGHAVTVHLSCGHDRYVR